MTQLKIRNSKFAKFGLVIAAFVSVAGIVVWLTVVSEASNYFTEHPSAAFGIARGQVARLNVVNRMQETCRNS